MYRIYVSCLSWPDLESCRKVAAMGGYGGADMFLSAEWGRGMEVDLPERCFQELSAAGVAPAAVGSEFVAELAVAVKPRWGVKNKSWRLAFWFWFWLVLACFGGGGGGGGYAGSPGC